MNKVLFYHILHLFNVYLIPKLIRERQVITKPYRLIQYLFNLLNTCLLHNYHPWSLFKRFLNFVLVIFVPQYEILRKAV